MSNQINKSYLHAYDSKHGWNFTTYFSFFNDFHRYDEDMKYVEVTFVAILCFASFVLNVGLISFFLLSKELRSQQHLFIVSVLSSSMLLLPFSLLIAVNRLSPTGWMYGDFVCRTTIFALLTVTFMKIWLMSIISLDRYLRVVHLPHRHLSQRSSILLTVAAWILPPATLAAMVYPNTETKQAQLDGNVTVMLCSAIFKYDATISYALIYFATVFVLEFLLPAGLMTFCYVKIMKKIKESSKAMKKHANRHLTAGRKETAKISSNAKEKRITTILIIILVLFLIMWTPFFALLAILSVDQRLETFYLSSRFIVGQVCFFVVNTIIEPFLFALTTGQIRQKLSSLCGQACKPKGTVYPVPASEMQTRVTRA